MGGFFILFMLKELKEITDYLKGTGAIAGLVQVDNCETEVVKSVNNLLVEFSFSDRTKSQYTVLVTSDTCLKTIKLAELVKERLEYRYRWLKTESVKRDCACHALRVTIEIAEIAKPAELEPQVILPQVLDTLLTIGFCPLKSLEPAVLNTSQNVLVPGDSDCCVPVTPSPSLKYSFTQADLLRNRYTFLATSPFVVRNNLGVAVTPQTVKIVGQNLYQIYLVNFVPIVGTWSITD